MRDKFSLQKLTGVTKQCNLNATCQLPLSMQKQRTNLLSPAAKFFKAGKRVQWRVDGTDYCLYANGELMADKSFWTLYQCLSFTIDVFIIFDQF